MDRNYLRFIASGTSERITDALTEQQYISPHQTVAQAIDAAGGRVGFCSEAVRRAVESLELDLTQAIGRVRRTELLQLSRAIGRHWRQSVGQPLPASTPM